MRFLLVFVFLLFQNKGNAQKKDFYEEADGITLSKYKLVDTLARKGSFVVTTREQTTGKFKSQRQCIEIDFNGHKRYFVLNHDTYLVNDSTICHFDPPFKVTGDDGGMMKNGIWVFTEFYTEKERNVFVPVESGGAKFVVDSIPPGWDYRCLPRDEGIYFFCGGSLVKISDEQSPEKFYSLRKNGFYFFPGSGRLFSKYDIRSIK